MRPHGLHRDGVRHIRLENPHFVGDASITIVASVTLVKEYVDGTETRETLDFSSVPAHLQRPFFELSSRVYGINSQLDALYPEAEFPDED